ncbi:glycosyltransferase family 4 protein [Methylocella sp.]|uniref:glycosyltransferase family 4 protein n=1 Tax=Methylocella sp. TaxID=1978226 RepID=UPI0037835C0E
MSSPLLMDLTRLIGRAQFETPTGIDRVEFEYARHLLDAHPDRLRFVLRWRGHMRFLNHRAAALFLRFMDEQWRYNKSQQGRRTTRAVQRFLDDAELGAFAAAGDSAERRVASRKLWRLKARLLATSKQLTARSLRGQEAIYVNVSHEGLHSESGLNALVAAGLLRPIFFVHDLIPITHPEYVKDGRPARHRRRMATMLKYGAALVANSRHTAEILSQYAQEHGFAPPQAAVAPLGSAFPVYPSPQGPAATPFFIALGTIEPRKNHIFLLQLWRQMVERHGESTPKLLVIGRRGWENENAIDLIERCPAIRSHVLECGCVGDDVLEYLISRCRAVLFPSFAEGYGMPLVEAMALKAPVIASDLAVFREIGGGAPEFLNPLDGPGWMRMIEAYAADDSPARTAQLRRIENVEIPSWKRHFAAFDAILASLALARAEPDAPRELLRAS